MSSKTETETRKAKNDAAKRDMFLHDWEGLRAFLDVARSRSMSGAAAELHLQHSTLSRRIKSLEDAIGVPLLRRSPRGVELTADGLELLSVLERFDEDLSSVGRWIKRGVQGMERPISVNIACTEGLAAYWLTLFLPTLRKRNMRACYNVHTAVTATPEKGKAFHATVQTHQPANGAGLEQIGSLHFSAVASKSYIDELGTYKAGDHPGKHRWIEYAPFRIMSGSWESWFQRKKIEVAPFTVTNSLVTTVNAVRQGCGIGLLPNYMMITEPDLVPLNAEMRLKFPIWLAVDAQGQDTPELSAALGLIRAAIDPVHMPWFRDRAEDNPNYDTWRQMLQQAISRLN